MLLLANMLYSICINDIHYNCILHHVYQMETTAVLFSITEVSSNHQKLISNTLNINQFDLTLLYGHPEIRISLRTIYLA
jgi:hypothetical protein